MNLIVECGILKITGGELKFVACRLANVLIFLQMSFCRFWQLERTDKYWGFYVLVLGWPWNFWSPMFPLIWLNSRQEAKEVVFELQRSLPKWRQVWVPLCSAQTWLLACQNSWIFQRFTEALSTVLECCTLPVSLVDISGDSAVPSWKSWVQLVLGMGFYPTEVQEDALQVLIESWVQIPRQNVQIK